MPLHAHRTEEVIGSEKQERSNGVRSGIRVEGGNGDGNGVGGGEGNGAGAGNEVEANVGA